MTRWTFGSLLFLIPAFILVMFHVLGIEIPNPFDGILAIILLAGLTLALYNGHQRLERTSRTRRTKRRGAGVMFTRSQIEENLAYAKSRIKSDKSWEFQASYWQKMLDGLPLPPAPVDSESAVEIEIISAPRPENDSHESAILRLYNSLKSPVGSESIYDWMLRADAALQKIRGKNE